MRIRYLGLILPLIATSTVFAASSTTEFNTRMKMERDKGYKQGYNLAIENIGRNRYEYCDAIWLDYEYRAQITGELNKEARLDLLQRRAAEIREELILIDMELMEE